MRADPELWWWVGQLRRTLVGMPTNVCRVRATAPLARCLSALHLLPLPLQRSVLALLATLILEGHRLLDELAALATALTGVRMPLPLSLYACNSPTLGNDRGGR
jgi:hypothetical protein